MKKSTDNFDKELWLKFLSGDKKAFGLIYKMYVKDLYQFGARITQNREQLQDTLQELFVSLWQNRNHLPPVKKVKSYLITCFRNKLYRSITSSQKTSVFSIEDFLQQTDVMQIEDDTQKEILSRELQRKITLLSQRQKEVVHLRYYQNLSLPEIAEVMNMKYQSVANLLQRSIEKLRCIWEEVPSNQAK